MYKNAPALLIATSLGLFAGCDPADEDLGIHLSDDRVVLTPGGSATIRIDIVRPESFEQDVHLKLFGVPDGVDASLSTHKTAEDHETITVTSTSDTAIEVDFTLKAWVGPHKHFEPIEVSVQELSDTLPGAEDYAPGVSGEVKVLTMNGVDVPYEVINGVAIANGDIVLGDAFTLEDHFRSATCNFSFNTEFTCSRWTDGVIGYRFADNWGGEAENALMRSLIEEAMEEWETKTGIRFVPRNSGQFLEFRNGGGCSSNVGRAVITGFDVQSISLNHPRCADAGIAMHEIGHAVGLYHEQSRDDREDFVSIDFGRVQDGKLHNFFQWGEYERDRGPYDYESIMHYGRSAFARNRAACDGGDLSECTVHPDDAMAAIGQRDFLTEGDVLGAYMLYPPVYTIEGASPGETGDRFFLSLDYDTPTPAADRIEWRSSLASEPIGTGHQLDLRSADVPQGVQVITAAFIVKDVQVTSEFIILNVSNDAPDVSLAANNGSTVQDLGQPFTVSATVNDTEDGTCPSPLCTYTWSPTPSSGPTGVQVANFTFHTVGDHLITLDVEDYGGAVGTGTLMVEVVNSPPTANIVLPSSDVVLSEGTSLALEGEATDINALSGSLPCSALTWSSSDPADTFLPGTHTCTPEVSFAGPGTRTISLTATDSQGEVSDPDTVDVTVNACAGNCDPTAFFSMSDAPDPSGYFLEIPITFTFTVADDNPPVEVDLVARRPGDPDIPVYAISLSADATWEEVLTLENSIADWPFCSNPSSYRDYDLVLTATDGDGGLTTQTVPVTLGCTLI